MKKIKHGYLKFVMALECFYLCCVKVHGKVSDRGVPGTKSGAVALNKVVNSLRVAAAPFREGDGLSRPCCRLLLLRKGLPMAAEVPEWPHAGFDWMILPGDAMPFVAST
jgi:hypothetical protein